MTPSPRKARLSPIKLKPTPTAKAFFLSLSFLLPIFQLYLFQPESFQSTWKGRAPYIFFLCLFFLELLRAWNKLPKKTLNPLNWTKTSAIAIALAAPTIYIVTAFTLGLNFKIVEIGKLLEIQRHGEYFLKDSWPLSLEYIFLTVFFAASIQLMYGINGSKWFTASLFFLGATGSFYMIDTFYPYGAFTPLQSFVPFTASSATLILGWMDYKTLMLSGPQGAAHLLIGGPTGGAHWYFYWPSAGVHSVITYTLVILLFIKDAPFSPQRKTIHASIPEKLRLIAKKKTLSSMLKREKIRSAIMTAETFSTNLLGMIPLYLIFTIGATGTFIANVLRIVYISIIGSKVGSEATRDLFHSYYGELFFVSWTIIYLMILLLLSRKIEQNPTRNG